jgi:STE24 endopeptidase
MYYDKHRPAMIKKHVKKEEFRKCQTYSKAKMQFGLLRKWLDFGFKVIVWSNGWPAMIWQCSSAWTTQFLTGEEGTEVDPVMYDFLQGMILILALQLLDHLLEIPLNLFSTFVIAENHGFNKQKLGGFFKDVSISQILTLVITPIIYYPLLRIIAETGDNFFIYAGLFITFFMLIIIVLAPLVIMPLFNKFDPIEENLLKRDIEALAIDCKYPVSNIEVVDGSKRSGHSNAFQYGFGKIKKIVIFDTLLD